MDFRRVTGLDASAASSFVRIKRLFQKHNIYLVFSQLPDQIQDQLQRDVLTQTDQKTWRVFPDLDRAIEWFEEELFHSEIGIQAEIQAKLGAVQVGQERGGLALLFAALMEEAERDHLDENQGLLLLMQYLERLELADGEKLIDQGDSHPYLYFLDAGALTIEHYRESNQPVRLETSGPGAVVGELSFYLSIPAPATVKASASSVVFRLSAENLQHLEHENPRAANLLHRFLLKRNGQRLLTIFEIVEALSD